MLTLEAAQTLRGVAGVATRITYTIDGFELSGGVEAYKKLAQGQLAASVGTLYTVPALTQGFVKSMAFQNTGGATTLQLFVGGTAASNAITGLFTLGSNQTLLYEDGGWRVVNGGGHQMQRSV